MVRIWKVLGSYLGTEIGCSYGCYHVLAQSPRELTV